MKYLFAAVHAPDWLKLGPKLDDVFRCGIDGIDIRIAGADPSRSELELARLVVGSGLTLRCHTWAGVAAADGTSKAAAKDGTRQGERLAHAALEMRVMDLASGNFEKDVWRGPNGRANPKAVDFIDAYITSFYEENRTCFIGDLGFADPDGMYLDADLDKDGDNDDELPPEVVSRFKRRGIMAYQNTVEAVTKKLASGRRVAGPDLPLSAWVSVGRIDKDGSVVGRSETTRTIAQKRPSGIDEIVFYVGFGAIGQVLEGHARHTSLATLVGEMRSVEAGRAIA